MATVQNNPAIPLRLWPGVVIVLALVIARFGIPIVAPDFTIYAVLSGLVGGIAIVVWWLFFSRARWPDRVGAIGLMIVAMLATWPLTHVSIATGAMGIMLPMLAIPGLCIAFVAAAVISRRFSDGPRRLTMAAAILLACGAWTLVRTGGFTGNFDNDLAWRWSPTPEERLLAQEDVSIDAVRTKVPESERDAASVPAPAPVVGSVNAATAESHDESAAAPDSPVPASVTFDWPGFRGPNRDGRTPGVRIETDWAATPPVELWRRPIGPGWSSFAVHGDIFYTQEQRGDDEIVAAYRVSTGQPVWMHRDAARFWESNGGAGPRATPTLSNGRVYAFGATGILNALEAADGREIWSRNVAADSQTKVPDWGFASSPLIVNDVVIVAAAGKLVAYDAATGALRWSAPGDDAGYSSPHLSVIRGVPQVLLVNGHGVASVGAIDGRRLWEHPLSLGAPIVQPALTADGDVLVGGDTALHRIAVKHEGGWSAEARWSSMGLKPYFNDFVLHNGHAFGFDGAILACVNLADGTRKWKAGRYGNGQLILLPDQDVLLVLSEEGELALVSATTDKFTELARRPAIEGKTWNHPVLAGDVLLVRNGQEMAAFRLARRR
jgi:outer membrane protein assembly factor BamB